MTDQERKAENEMLEARLRHRMGLEKARSYQRAVEIRDALLRRRELVLQNPEAARRLAELEGRA